MRNFLLLVAICACGVDSEDPPEDPGDCCWRLTEKGVAECIRDAVPDFSVYDLNEDGCIDVRCFPSTVDYHVIVCPE